MIIVESKSFILSKNIIICMSNKSDIYIEAKKYTEGTYVINTEDDESVPIHKLVAVAKYGIDKVSQNKVYHMNRIKWDNRHSNICLVKNKEELNKLGYWTMEDGEPKYHIHNGTIQELAKK